MSRFTVKYVAISGISACVPSRIEENITLSVWEEEAAVAFIKSTISQKKEELECKNLKHVACGFGVGLSWGSVYFETNKLTCTDLIEYR